MMRVLNQPEKGFRDVEASFELKNSRTQLQGFFEYCIWITVLTSVRFNGRVLFIFEQACTATDIPLA